MNDVPRRPRWWQWALAGGAAVAALAGTIDSLTSLASSRLGPVAWAVLAVALVGLVVNVLLDARGRRLARAEAEPAPAVPEQPPGVHRTLPYASGFIGRDDDVASIVDACRSEHAVAVVGRRGVGTSSCAVRAANLLRDRFPHGQLYLDLRAGGRPLRARGVLVSLGRTLGTPPPRSGRPGALADTAAALRNRLDDQEVLLVLDNVDDPAQVRPLLPPTSRCRVLLAGMPSLADLPGVAVRRLSEPDGHDAVALFAAAMGEPSRRGDPRRDPAVRELVDRCGRQPRAVRALGYRMARHGSRSQEVLTALRRAVAAPTYQRTSYLELVALMTAWDDAYRAASRPAQRLYRLMSLVPAALDRPAIAALTGQTPVHVGRLLDRLVADGFLAGAPGDRYQVRPLLVSYARLHLRHTEPLRRRVRAHARLVRHLARQVERHTDPYGWCELHHELLLAVVTAPAGAVVALPRRVRRWWFRLAVALCGWYAHEDRLDEWAGVCRAVLDTPTADDRPEIAGWAHNEVGVLRRRSGDPAGAAAALRLAVAERGRGRGNAQARTNLGLALLDQSQVDEAIEHLELASRQRSHADRAGQALTELALGAAYLATDEVAPAHHHLVRAANAFHAIGDTRGYAAALTDLVLAQWRLGEHLDAAQSWAAALRAYETIADPGGRAAALLNAGAALLAANPPRPEQAYPLLGESRRLREQRRATPGLGRTLLYLGDAANLLGRHDDARGHWTDAAGLCEAVGDADGLAAASERLAAAP